MSAALQEYLRDREARRNWSLTAQDGIVGTAGILLGFTGAGATQGTLVVAGVAATVAGMLTTGGAKWSETASERDAELRAMRVERREIRQQPDAEKDELASYYRRKGLDDALAAQVADVLMRRAPLRAGLESEYGMLELTSRADVILSGVGAAIAYALGAVIPFLIVYFLPVSMEMWVIVVSVIFSLVLTSIVGARAGHMDIARTMQRSLLVGLVTIFVSYLVGQLAF